LPEAQKDRFMLKITMNYPETEQEYELAQRTLGANSPEAVLASGQIRSVMDEEFLTNIRTIFQTITVREELVRYAVELVRATRRNSSILVGAGPRATQALLLSSRAHAILEARDFTTPDDIKTMALPVLEHRLILRPEYELEGLTVTEVVQKVLQDVAVPR
jgi:MoxR-like ATPase